MAAVDSAAGPFSVVDQQVGRWLGAAAAMERDIIIMCVCMGLIRLLLLETVGVWLRQLKLISALGRIGVDLGAGWGGLWSGPPESWPAKEPSMLAPLPLPLRLTLSPNGLGPLDELTIDVDGLWNCSWLGRLTLVI